MENNENKDITLLKGNILSQPTADTSYLMIGKRNDFSNEYCWNGMLPVEWLDNAIEFMKYRKPVLFHADDGEIADYYILVSNECCFILSSYFYQDNLKEESCNEYLDITAYEFCSGLYSDINSNLDSWSDWIGETLLPRNSQSNTTQESDSYSEFEKCIEQGKQMLQDRLNTLKRELDKYQKEND